MTALPWSGGKDQRHEGVSLDGARAKGASSSGLVFIVGRPRTLNGVIVRQELDRSASPRWAGGGSPHLCLRVVSFLSQSFISRAGIVVNTSLVRVCPASVQPFLTAAMTHSTLCAFLQPVPAFLCAVRTEQGPMATRDEESPTATRVERCPMNTFGRTPNAVHMSTSWLKTMPMRGKVTLGSYTDWIESCTYFRSSPYHTESYVPDTDGPSGCRLSLTD